MLLTVLKSKFLLISKFPCERKERQMNQQRPKIYQAEVTGLKLTAGQRTMSGLIEALTGQTFDLPVMLTGQN